MNKTCYSFVFAGTLCLISSSIRLAAQDLHYSQYYMNPQHQNPALTGIFDGDQRATAQYRSQWETVPVQYRTAAAGFESKIIAHTHNSLSGGLLLQHDKAGDGGLTWTQVGLNLNAAHALSARQIISLGIGASFVQRAVNLDKLKFNNQWNGDIYDPARDSKEILNSSSGLKASIGAGLNWHFQMDNNSRTMADAGVSAGHVNRPNISLLDGGTNQLPMRFCVYGQSYIQYSELADIFVFSQFQQMGKAHETLIGSGIRYWLEEESSLQLACGTRIGDAIIPSVAIQRKQWTVGISYDINISDFKVATGRRGGFEIAAIYTTAPVKPIKEMKICPVF